MLGNYTHRLLLVIKFEDNLLKLQRLLAVLRVLDHVEPVTLRHAEPFSTLKSGMCRSNVGRVRRRKKGRVFDSGKDVEVAECGENEDEDDGLYGEIDVVRRERPHECTHGWSVERRGVVPKGLLKANSRDEVLGRWS